MSDVLLASNSKEDIDALKNDKTCKEQPVNNESSTNVPILPRSCRPLAHQVAGHRHGKGRLGIGMLQHADGTVLKPVQPPPRGERELGFYKKLFEPACDDPVLMTLRPFLPKFLGTWAAPTSSEKTTNAHSYLKLEDVCRRFRNPSILDVKIGRVSYDPEADDRKRSVERAKYPPLAELGFQLLGMRISGPSPNEAVFYGKDYGRSITEDRIADGLNLFLSGNVAWKKYIVKAFVQRLEMILTWFESQQRYQFYSSSLLLIYEGEFFDGSSDSDEEFIHKYQQMRIPSMYGDSYLDTVRRFMNRHLDAEKNAVDKKCSMTLKQDDKPNVITSPVPSTGQESGYSSEVESKASQRSKSFQREFVTSLNRRIQELSLAVNKYRFPPDIVDVRMIDFAHVFEEPKSDDNYIFGLRNLIKQLKQIQKTL